MLGFTNVSLLGVVLREPELRHTSTDVPVCNTVIAVNGIHDKTAFVPVVFWGQAAEVFTRYPRKGVQVIVLGELESETRVDKVTGEKRNSLRVSARKFVLVGDPKQDEDEVDEDDTQELPPVVLNEQSHSS